MTVVPRDLPGQTILIGALLLVLGLGGYFATGRVSLTALIPAAFGLLLAALGAIARSRPTGRKAAMHVAVVVAVVGMGGAARGAAGLVPLLSGGTVERPAAVVAQALMAALCLLFVTLGVRSFVRARLARRTGG